MRAGELTGKMKLKALFATYVKTRFWGFKMP
jgi:hypothetical protein